MKKPTKVHNLSSNKLNTIDLEYILRKVVQKRHIEITNTLQAKFSNRKWIKSYELLELLSIAKGRIEQMRKSELLVGEKDANIYYYTIESIKEVIEKYRPKNSD